MPAAVRPTATTLSLSDKPGGPSLRDQIRTQERSLAAKEKTALAKAPDDAARHELKTEFTEARRERAQKYAAMLCSEKTWEPRGSEQGQVLTSFYRLLGERGRELAAKQGKPFSMKHLDEVQLTKADVEDLRKQFGDEAVKKAMPLLEKHICSGRWLSKEARTFMKSSRFVAYQTAVEATVDRVERNLEHEREKLDDADAERLREDLRTREKRKVTSWTENVVVEREERPDGTREKTLYASVGGRLVPVDKKPE
jgi:hypothetical protein